MANWIKIGLVATTLCVIVSGIICTENESQINCVHALNAWVSISIFTSITSAMWCWMMIDDEYKIEKHEATIFHLRESISQLQDKIDNKYDYMPIGYRPYMCYSEFLSAKKLHGPNIYINGVKLETSSLLWDSLNSMEATSMIYSMLIGDDITWEDGTRCQVDENPLITSLIKDCKKLDKENKELKKQIEEYENRKENSDNASLA